MIGKLVYKYVHNSRVRTNFFIKRITHDSTCNQSQSNNNAFENINQNMRKTLISPVVSFHFAVKYLILHSICLIIN